MPTKVISRRTAVFSGSAAVIAAALSGCAATKLTTSNDRKTDATPTKTFVLVHGAWHGAWCWDLVKQKLEHSGHRVFSPTLTGLGDRADEMSAETGLQTHIDDVVDLIEQNNLSDIVLVGHSYGGMVITGVADALKKQIGHIVYLDAALPKNGQSMISYGSPKSAAEIKETAEQLKKLAPDGVGMAVFPPEFLGVPVGHPRYNWVKSKLTPHPLKTWLDEIELVNGGPSGLERTYAHCTDPVLPRTSFPYIAKKAKKNPKWSYHELKTGHDAMITAPDEVTEILENS